jgi:predicted phage baseplate assembly protein
VSSTLFPPHSSSRRAALLERLIVALTSTGPDVLSIRTRAPDDPTIALLDAWATVGDVLGFYLDRIADEGYLTTATQPGSILALANLVGFQPTPSLAARVYLAYSLTPDAADGAVQFSPGLLFQSVPRPGQQPQTFESAGTVIARPSWNLLAPKSTQPLPASTTSLVVDSTTAGLSPNDMILLELAGTSGTGASSPYPVLVASATVDHTARVTNVTLQAPAVPPSQPPTTAPPASPPPPNATAAVDDLINGGLGKPTPPVPESANQLTQTAQSVFSPGSDAVLRLISTLQPAVAPTLYAALDATAIGPTGVTGACVMRVTAAPFGAAAAPQPVVSASGQPAGTGDRPIGYTFTLQLSITRGDFPTVLDRAGQAVQLEAVPGWLGRAVAEAHDAAANPVLDVQWSAATFTSQATIDVGSLPAGAPAPPGFGAVELRGGEGEVTLSYAGYTAPAAPSAPSPPSTPPLQVTACFTEAADAVKLEFTFPETHTSGTLIWDPELSTPFSGQVGDAQVTIAWATSPSGEATLTFSIAVPLPLPKAAQKVLLLDRTYPGITPGSYVVIDSAGPAGIGIRYPVITQPTSVDTVAVTGYGITAKVTRLALKDKWIDSTATLQSALRPLTVHAQPAALPLQPAPDDADVSGSSIDRDGLVAGMEPGRLIAVTGTRTDLPAGSTVQSGEIAMVASVSAGGDGGDTTYSTLNLALPLAYSYQRATVQIYGNVVPAHQGATISQVLGSGQPAQAPQSFTLSSGPLLADPAASGPGFASTLTVTVNGVGYAQADRFDASTPAQSFLVGTNASGQTTIVFPAPLPAGTGNIIASYRAGDGRQGNVQAAQITQLLSRPASLSSVTNPLPAAGGSGGDDQESVRAAIPGSLSGLGRVVTVSDYVSLASSIAGVGKASAALTPGTGGVVVTIAGTDPVQLSPVGSLCTGVAKAIAAVTDPAVPVQVLPASLYLIALTAEVIPDPLVSWDATVAAVQAALLASFRYAQRDLGQDVAVSDLLAAAHAATGVLSVKVTGLALVPAAASANALSTTLPTLLTDPVPAVATLAAVPSQWNLPPLSPAPAAVAYLSDTAPGTLILSEASS